MLPLVTAEANVQFTETWEVGFQVAEFFGSGAEVGHPQPGILRFDMEAEVCDVSAKKRLGDGADEHVRVAWVVECHVVQCVEKAAGFGIDDPACS